MQVDYRDVERRIKAAQALLSESTTSLEKLRSIKTILAGINPRIDNALTECDKQLLTIERGAEGEVVDLAVDALPEDTDERKNKKKALLLFLKYWNGLKDEVARVQAEMDANQSGSQDTTSMWTKIAAGAKGPIAIVTIAAVAVAGAALALDQTSVTITIENQGCPTLYAGQSGVSLPGLSLPSSPIGAGESANVTTPPFTLTADGTGSGALVLSSVGLTYTIELGGAVSDVLFNGESLLGTVTTIDLGSKDAHTLVLECS